MYKEQFDAVVRELNTDYNTLENANKIFKRQVYFTNDHSLPSRRYNFHDYLGWAGYKSDGYIFYTVFGAYVFNREKGLMFVVEKLSHRGCGRRKNGIEVLGMRLIKTKTGAYKYEGTTVEELKNACKKNGIKIGKMNKLDLVCKLLKM